METHKYRMADYPYPLHTNRELEMMLAGTKPFAMFAHERVEGFEKRAALAGQDFDAHVKSGVLSEHVGTIRHASSGVDIDYYFYALPGEEWRVEACLLLLEMLHRGAWCRQLEWLEGRLLGYTDEQNEYHLARAYPDGWKR
ncbi:hypothetical protein [Aminobacter sp. LjRoot7]|uniref:hypothetical protein n=1 Tax=Aminobacter sp. LjRoot7 TaxID=3342335 RepID=UPI003ECF389A